MNFKKSTFLSFSFLSLFFATSAFDNFSNSTEERILSFDSKINVQKDSSIIVEETIEVLSNGYRIKRGIYRDFPTTYHDNMGNRYVVALEVQDVQRDNHKEPYHIKNAANGKRIFIGDKNILLEPGIHTYKITYKTNRQIGFFKSYDNLFWNVTGNGWIFPIDKVTATVVLPEDLKENQIDFDAYTGYQNSNEKNFQGKIENNKVIFHTTFPLQKFQGFTIDVVWQKGHIKAPTFWDKVFWFFKDNLNVIWAILCLIILLIFYLIIWDKIRNRQYKTVIPLFDPPANLSPGAIRYINKMGYDNKIFTAQILEMAVKGFLKIEYEDKEYKLKKENSPDESSEYYLIWKRLFGHTDKLALNSKNSNIINHVKEIIKADLEHKYKEIHFTSNFEYIGIGFIISIIGMLPLLHAWFNNSFFGFVNFIIYLPAFIIVNLIFTYLFKTYTKQGLDILNEIKGFKMFLSFTQKERFKILNAPQQTPDEFETLLPYAVALDVEQKWANQFKTLFDVLAQKNIIYAPSWYVGSNFNAFHVSSFSSSLNNTISNVISSSNQIPGTTTGFGNRGGGGSGRGGGGGGGGGW